MAKFNFFTPPVHDRKLIPDGRFASAMPWVMAIMVFLTLLACAAAIVLANAATQGRANLAREATVQLLDSDPAARMAQQKQVAILLKTLEGVAEVSPVPDKEARALLQPWLGDAAADADIPVPALIDVSFAEPPSAAQLASIRKQVRTISNDVRIDANGQWLTPFFDLMRSLLLLASIVVLLLLLATAATVGLAVRGALNTHRSTLEIIHMMGSTDIQAARLFQRRVALDALFGGFLGFAVSALVIWLISNQFSALESGLISQAGMPIYGWLLLAMIPLAVTGLASMMARWTVLSVLKKML